MIAHSLRWADIDPSIRAPYDPARAEAIVRPLVAAAATRRTGGFREQLLDQLQRELMIAFGVWIDGWTWSVGSGGIVSGWCCTQHSVFPQADDPAGGPRTDLADADDRPVAATTARVLAAIQSWVDSLHELAALFAEIRAEQALASPEETALVIEYAVEAAAARVLPWVVARTHTEDAWYGTYTQVLSWYVETAGFDSALAHEAIEDTVDGTFESWSEPTAPVAAATCSAIGRAIRDVEAGEPRDATATWRSRRASAFLNLPIVAHVATNNDGHRAYIEQRDRARDPERAERMLAALELCRDSARHDMALTFDQMCEWQAAVLGDREVGFRGGDAFAKRGREKYPFTPLTQAWFEESLRDADGPGEVAVRAARVYLDICFYHPFPDGNARAARLALDHVLTRAGYALRAAEPVFVVSRSVDDRYLGGNFARLLDRMMGPIA